MLGNIMRTQYYWRTREHSIIKGTAINEPTININFQGIDSSKDTSENSKNKDKSRTNNGIKRVNNAFLRQWQDQIEQEIKINKDRIKLIEPKIENKKKIKNQSAYNVVIFNKGYNCYN